MSVWYFFWELEGGLHFFPLFKEKEVWIGIKKKARMIDAAGGSNRKWQPPYIEKCDSTIVTPGCNPL